MYIPQEGKSALILATERGHVEVARLLISAGALVDQRDKVRILAISQYTVM